VIGRSVEAKDASNGDLSKAEEKILAELKKRAVGQAHLSEVTKSIDQYVNEKKLREVKTWIFIIPSGGQSYSYKVTP
jgi:hypothetical protein